MSDASSRGVRSATARVDHAAATQDGHPIGQLEDLVDAVRDVKHARASAPDLADELEQLCDLVRRQHGGRLVQDKDAPAAVPALQRGDDRHHDPLDRRGLGQRPVQVDVEPEAARAARGR